MIFNELWEAFNDIYFEEGPHTYTDSVGTQYTSVTTFCGQFQKEKDWNLIAEKSAFNRAKAAIAAANPKLKKDQVIELAKIESKKLAPSLRKEWSKSGDYAKILGTEVHAVMEYLWQNKDYEGNKDKMALYPGMIEDFEYRKGKCKEIFNSLKKMYVPVKNEYIVYDRDWKLCGTIDFLAWNKIKKCYAILDWKTSKEFTRENKYGETLKEPFSVYPACNCTEYSIQLSTYKAILEKHCPNIKIGELVLIQLPKEGTEPDIFRCYDFSDILTKYLDNRKES